MNAVVGPATAGHIPTIIATVEESIFSAGICMKYSVRNGHINLSLKNIQQLLPVAVEVERGIMTAFKCN